MIAHSKDAVPDVVIAALEYFIAPYTSSDSIITSSGKLKSTLSADHRVLDGTVAGKLLKDFHEIIEEPFVLWLKSSDMEII